MGWVDLIRRNRASLSAAVGDGRYRAFSASTVSRTRETQRLITTHVRGRVLDVGCGHMPFRDAVLAGAKSYEGLDVQPRVEGVDYVSDAEEMAGVPLEAFDTVLCSEVLEHVPDPGRVLTAIYRVLRPGGRLIITVPHLSRLHEEPFDFYRFTGYGLTALFERAGFEVLEVGPHGGLCSFLSHQASTVLLGTVWRVPIVRDLAYHLNRAALVYPALWLDRVLNLRRIYPLGYAAAGLKPHRQRGRGEPHDSLGP